MGRRVEPLPTASPRIIVGGRDAICDAELLARLRVSQIVGVGCRSPPITCTLPVIPAPLDLDVNTAADVLVSQLACGAALLRDALAAPAVPATILAVAPATAITTASAEMLNINDCDPGTSSDEEGGGTEGVRIRTRVARKPDEKWGLMWHANIFKMSQRLVVKEIAENSAIARWNMRQSDHLRVGYGDRLMRINGVREDENNAAEMMRAELKKPKIRALFWRPSSYSTEEQEGNIEHPTEAAPSTAAIELRQDLPDGCSSTIILVCDTVSDDLAGAAAVVVAHELLRGTTGGEDILQRCFDMTLHAALGNASESLLLQGASGRVDIVLAALRLLESGGGIHGDSTGCCSCRARAELQHSLPPCVVEDDCGALAALRSAEDDVFCKDGVGAVHMEPGLDAGVACAIDAAVVTRQPQWTYSCRKCGVGLFHDTSLLPHQVDGVRKASRPWAKEGGVHCTSIFVEPMKWMGELAEETGKLLCGNPRCQQKLGSFSWHGLPCSCGHWQSPAFQVHCARIERMPIERRARGPAPKPVFEA